MEGKHRITPAIAQTALGPMALPAPPSVTINPVLILGVMAYNCVGVMRTVATTFLSQIVAKLRLFFSP